jgi:leader peptidase (prepilin peptidase)/N-methyltransferase
MDIFVLVPILYLAAVTVPLAVTDIRSHRLPNALVVPGLVLLAWALVGAALRAPAAALGGVAPGGPADALVGVAPGGPADALVGVAPGGPADALAGMGAAAIGAVALGVGWIVGAVGMGDVKLGVWLGGMAGMTGMLGRPEGVARGLVAAGMLAGVQLVAMLAGGVPLTAARIPLGPALLAAFWVAATAGAGLLL